MRWYLQALKKAAVYTGRARRKEYWMFILVSVLIGAVLTILETAMTGGEPGQGGLVALYQIAMMVPGIAVGVRRMHDTNHRGWWLLVPLVNLLFALQEGQRGDNRFGPDPKAEPNAASASAAAPAVAHTTTGEPVVAAARTPGAFCIRCGAHLPDSAAFCPSCGAQRVTA